jgi:hypothetical protein
MDIRILCASLWMHPAAHPLNPGHKPEYGWDEIGYPHLPARPNHPNHL